MAADQGYALAENDLGYLYDYGIGTSVNHKRATELYHRAAEHGNVTAQVNLGICYEYGRMVNKNIPKAVRYYTMAAESGNEKAKKALRRLNAPLPEPKPKQQDSGPSTKLSEAELPVGFDSLLERANKGDVDAVFRIGTRYADGSGVPHDYSKAAEWYEMAANRGHAQAQNNLGVLYHDGKGVAQDYRKAREWYEKAAAQNNAHAFDNLGMIYFRGDGVNIDYKKAFDYFSKGAERGIARSMNQLGWMYEHGQYVNVDYKKAMEWYTKGADKGNYASMNNLGRMHEDGIGTSKDLRKAMEYYRQSAAKGNKKAQEAIARLEAPQKPSAPAVAKTTPKTPQKPSAQPKTQSKPAQPAPAAPVSPTLFANTTSHNKPRLVILDFDDKSTERKANTSSIMTTMTTELNKADVFRLLESERLDDIKGEINLGLSEFVDASTAVKIGKFKGAQYVMFGVITLCYYSEKASGFVFPILGIETKANTAYVVLDIRIVNVETREIVYTETKTGEYTQKSNKASLSYKGVSAGVHNKMIGGLLEMAAHDAIDKHISAIRVMAWQN